MLTTLLGRCWIERNAVPHRISPKRLAISGILRVSHHYGQRLQTYAGYPDIYLALNAAGSYLEMSEPKDDFKRYWT